MLLIVGLVNVISRIGAAQKKAVALSQTPEPPPASRRVEAINPESAVGEEPAVPEGLRRLGVQVGLASRSIDRFLAGMGDRPLRPAEAAEAETSREPEKAPRARKEPPRSTPSEQAGGPHAARASAARSPTARSQPATVPPAVAGNLTSSLGNFPRSASGSGRKAWTARRMRDGIVASMVLAPPPSASL